MTKKTSKKKAAARALEHLVPSPFSQMFEVASGHTLDRIAESYGVFRMVESDTELRRRLIEAKTTSPKINAGNRRKSR